MTITARNIGRINVWPTYDIAREADTEESKFVGQLTVWRTPDEARANISHEEDGGGELDWVPEGAVIHIDLVRAFNALDAAWTAADGVVAVDTLLGSDANTENGWSETEYLPEGLTADGYTYSAHAPAAIGSLRSAMIAGATVIMQMKQISGGQIEAIFVSADGNDAIEIKLDSYFSAFSWNGSLNEFTDPVQNVGDGAINKMAFTLLTSRCDIAANGSEAETGVVDGTDWPPGNPLVAIALEHGSHALQSITRYDALPSTAGLSALSEVT